jgi:HD-GYP domain-containing protein (c-di-GMP phosphodiesterase class II)
MAHPLIGARIVSAAGFSKEIVDAVLFHHKRYDHTGYPKDLNRTGNELFTTIIEAADALDAMTSKRTYKPLMSRQEVIAEFELNRATQFCPRVVAALVSSLCEDEVFEQCIMY